jgi:hypothetical protein
MAQGIRISLTKKAGNWFVSENLPDNLFGAHEKK